MRKPHVISPAVGDNLLDIEEATEEEEEEEETLIARSRRVLPKTAFVKAQEADKEETESDEVIGKGECLKRRRQKQEARTGPRKRARKAKSSVQEDEEKEEVRFQIRDSSPSAEELDKEIDEILAEALHHPFISNSLITLDALKEHLNDELSSEKKRLTELATAALQLKSDMVKVTKEKQSVEEENERLKAELEKERSKGKRSRERLIVEKRNLVEERLPKQLNFMTKEARREYAESEEFIGMFNRAYAPDRMKIDVKVLFRQEEVPKIEKESTEWKENYDIGIFTFIEEWGKEIAEMFSGPSSSEIIVSPPASASKPSLTEHDAPPPQMTM
ncbi:hypothetical protein Dimus_035592 [Dionaea muscipula]